MAAKLLRRDLDPNEARVRVRIRTFGEGFVWKGYTIDVREASDTALDERFPLKVGTVELEMFASHAAELRADALRLAATDEHISRANDDLRSDLIELGAIEAPNARTPIASTAKVAELIEAGLTGKTSKPYRPSFVASYKAMNRRDFHPILSVEVAGAGASAQKKS